MFEFILNIYTACLVLALIFVFIRLIKGPHAFDRAVAFDCTLYLIVGLVLLESIRHRTADYLDILLVLSLLGFVGTLAIAAYLEGTLLD